MAERKELFKVNYISDHDCGSYKLGEIDSICDEQIKKYIDSYDEYGYQQLIDFLVRSIATSHRHMYNKRIKKLLSYQAGS